MADYLDIIDCANNANPDDYTPLYINGKRIGFLNRAQQTLLRDYHFELERKGSYLQWKNASIDQDENTAKIAEITKKLYQNGLLEAWRNEQYALAKNYQDRPEALVERASMPVFGACGYGVHINGLVKQKDTVHMWVSKRSADKSVDPNKLDQIAAGGMPWGISPFDNMQKECAEEANISKQLSQKAIPVGTGSYCHKVANGIRGDVMFLYDLWLPDSFKPQNTDGEAQAFYLVPLPEIPEMLCNTDQVKFNSALVMIDCLIRFGIINERTNNYELICDRLRSRTAWIRRVESR